MKAQYLLPVLFLLTLAMPVHSQYFMRSWTESVPTYLLSQSYPGQGSVLYMRRTLPDSDEIVRLSISGDTLFTKPGCVSTGWGMMGGNYRHSDVVLANGNLVAVEQFALTTTAADSIYTFCTILDAAGNQVYSSAEPPFETYDYLNVGCTPAPDSSFYMWYYVKAAPGTYPSNDSMRFILRHLSGTGAMLSQHQWAWAPDTSDPNNINWDYVPTYGQLILLANGRLGLLNLGNNLDTVAAGTQDALILNPDYSTAFILPIRQTAINGGMPGMTTSFGSCIASRDSGLLVTANTGSPSGSTSKIYRFSKTGALVDSFVMNTANAQLSSSHFVELSDGRIASYSWAGTDLGLTLLDAGLNYLYTVPDGPLGGDNSVYTLCLQANAQGGVFATRTNLITGYYEEAVVMNTDSNFFVNQAHGSGQVYVDKDNNCVFASPDVPEPNAKVIFTDSGTGEHWYAFSDAQGSYNVPLPFGNYSISHAPNFLNKAPACMTQYSAVLGTGSTTASQVFADTLNSLQDVRVNIFPAEITLWNGASVHIQARNMGGQNYSGTLTVTLDTLLEYASCSVAGTTVSGNSVNIPVTLDADSVQDVFIYAQLDTSAVSGSIAGITASLPLAGDAHPGDNTDTLTSPVEVSYDPNNKQVNKPLHIYPSQNELIYRIRYQNCGTAAARNVRIIDPIDSLFDVASIAVLYASPAMPALSWQPKEGITFWMPDIWLPDSGSNEAGSYGEVVYAISLRPSAAIGDTVRNTAAIYFDYNAPVFTDTTLNVLTAAPLAAPSPEFAGAGIGIWPNPSGGFVYCTLPGPGAWLVTLTDITGHNIRQWNLSGGSTASPLRLTTTPGLYLMRFANTVSKQICTKKVVIQ